MDGVQAVMKKHIMDGLNIPVIVVGGVVPEDVRRLIGSNIHGVAFSAALRMAKDRSEVIEDFKQQILKSKKKENGIIENSRLQF